MTPALDFMVNFDFRLVHDFSSHVVFHLFGVWVNQSDFSQYTSMWVAGISLVSFIGSVWKSKCKSWCENYVILLMLMMYVPECKFLQHEGFVITIPMSWNMIFYPYRLLCLEFCSPQLISTDVVIKVYWT